MRILPAQSVRDDVDDGLNRGRLLMLTQPLPVLFLGDAVLADRVNGAPGFHAIELRVDAPNLFYQPVNDRARGERPHSKDDNRRHGRSFLFSIIPLVVCQTYAGT